MNSYICRTDECERYNQRSIEIHPHPTCKECDRELFRVMVCPNEKCILSRLDVIPIVEQQQCGRCNVLLVDPSAVPA